MADSKHAPQSRSNLQRELPPPLGAHDDVKRKGQILFRRPDLREEFMKFFVVLMFIFLLPLKTFAAGGIDIDYSGKPGPIFDIKNWAPGNVAVNTITIKNNNTVSERIGFKIDKALTENSLANVIKLTIRNNPSGTVKYERALSEAYLAGEIELETLGPGAASKYDFIALFEKNAGDSNQSNIETFDLTIGFIGTAAGTPSGAGGLMGIITRALGFDAGASMGAQDVTEGGGVAGVGSEKEEAKDGKNVPAVTIICPWWWIIILAFLACLANYSFLLSRRGKKGLPRKWWMVPVGLGIAAWGAHYLLSLGYKSSIFCKYFWIILFLITVIFLFTIRVYMAKRKE